VSENSAVLSIKDLRVHFFTEDGVVKAVDGVSFDLQPGERLGLVGESGCGKTTMALGLLRMIKPPGRIVSGQAWMDGIDLYQLDYEEMRMARALKIGMIPQGAMNSLVPVLKIKDQIIDALEDHKLGYSKEKLHKIAVDSLVSVGLPAKVADMYPHQLSGGMKQRVCAAVALAMMPKVIIADEPTSALDVITQRQVMETIGKLQTATGASVILIGHDMGLMAQFVNRVAVMYAGKLVEVGTVRQIFTDPLHPYTRLLISALPMLSRKGVFVSIPGIAPSLLRLPTGCVFHPRCPKAKDTCQLNVPKLMTMEGNRVVSCHLYSGEVSQ
jgi:oligopeptide/dipeptide ABC transporter ATP-binding protein